ncbi:MAG: hypothetical protein EOM20_07970 [Spartobacteria bacterium]|nr:hypothetical protein [Spartobacteria bacterium]
MANGSVISIFQAHDLFAAAAGEKGQAAPAQGIAQEQQRLGKPRSKNSSFSISPGCTGAIFFLVAEFGFLIVQVSR